jgi:hypothetical protein
MEAIMQLVVEPDGRVRCLYGEAVDLAALGVLSIRRASHVEPDEEGHWWADLSPVRGPVLGPFAQRSLALVAEQDWLERNWLERNRLESTAMFPSS